MARLRKRPCRNCLRWFYPDPRVGDRQRPCGQPECRAVGRQKTQVNWRRRNPRYAAYRIETGPADERDQLLSKEILTTSIEVNA
jgi:hypothetical protein